MATIKIEIVAGGTTHMKTKTVSAAHLVRLLNALRSIHGAALTDAQAFEAWTDGVLAETKARVRGWEQTAAVVTDIDFT